MRGVISSVEFAPATLGAVIEKYLNSDEFRSKSRGTQISYRSVLDRLKQIAGRCLIADLRERHVREIRSRFQAASVADLYLNVSDI
jgi:hypothetical protein